MRSYNNANIPSGPSKRHEENKNREGIEGKKKETPDQHRKDVTYWHPIPKGYVKATSPSVASMESRHTLKG